MQQQQQQEAPPPPPQQRFRNNNPYLQQESTSTIHTPDKGSCSCGEMFQNEVLVEEIRSSDDDEGDDDDDDSYAVVRRLSGGNTSGAAGAGKSSTDDGISCWSAPHCSNKQEDDNNNNVDDNDNPARLVQRDNRHVLLTKLLVLGVLLGSAVVTSVFIFRYTRQTEEDAFRSDYRAVATTILDSFSTDLTLKFFAARTLSALVSAVDQQNRNYYHNLDSANTSTTTTTTTTTTVPHAQFLQATSEAKWIVNARYIAYSPLLFTEDARTDFEAYAQNYLNEQGPFFAPSTPPQDNVTTTTTTQSSLPWTLADGIFILDPDTGTARPAPRLAERYNNNNNTAVAAAATQSQQQQSPPPPQSVSSDSSGSSNSGNSNSGSVVPPFYSPLWQAEARQVQVSPTMYDQASDPVRRRALEQLVDRREPVLSETFGRRHHLFYTTYFGTNNNNDNNNNNDSSSSPSVYLYYPVFRLNKEGQGRELLGSVVLEFVWESFLTSIYPPNSNNVHVVIENTCGQTFTYIVNIANQIGDYTEHQLVLVGPGNLHQPQFDNWVRHTTFDFFGDVIWFSKIPYAGGDNNGHESTLESCRYRFLVYPTQAMEDQYLSNNPILYSVLASVIFLFTSLVFVGYDSLVKRRQSKIMNAATRTNDIVSELFPKQVRDRLYQQQQALANAARHRDAFRRRETAAAAAAPTPSMVGGGGGGGGGEETTTTSHHHHHHQRFVLTGTNKMQMHNFLHQDGGRHNSIFGAEPIADLFPFTTVLYIDICNFTAWSSERGPEQVFTLLEALFHEYDHIGRTMGIFKVETAGDSYIAVTGLPEPSKNHAAVMVKYAYRCLRAMGRITRHLEVTLGPDTGDLKARVGIHSGPVTAGVLRGEKARFQLFGDTVNVAAKVEAAGLPRRIQITQQTADLLKQAGKSHWIKPRPDLVEIKGKGPMQLYWANPYDKNAVHSAQSETSVADVIDGLNDLEMNVGPQEERPNAHDKIIRLVNWNVQVLYGLLERVVAARKRLAVLPSSSEEDDDPDAFEHAAAAVWANHLPQEGRAAAASVIDEFTEILKLPKFDPKLVETNSFDVEVITNPRVKEQLYDLVLCIAQTYRDVPFHNFEHASHVIQSTEKMMKRIVKPDDVNYELEGLDEEGRAIDIARQIHNSTYGFSSDHLLHFTAVFSALIHDADHTGLTNKELIDLQSPLAAVYQNTSIAEQNSVDITWRMLMDPKYRDLRRCIYSNAAEMKRFRELLVNAVMATDIADKRLQSMRKNRWVDAFAEGSGEGDGMELGTAGGAESPDLDVDRKATIVYEHLIQASDVSHTMQHWNTFRKYNARLFEERYVAWLKNGGENDPSVGWYKGEMGFFDFYIIPLAHKLDRCGVFGVSYHEYIHHAEENRREWENRGEPIVAEMLLFCQKKYSNGLASVIQLEKVPDQAPEQALISKYNASQELFGDEAV